MKALLLVLILDVLAVMLVLSDQCAEAKPEAMPRPPAQPMPLSP